MKHSNHQHFMSSTSNHMIIPTRTFLPKLLSARPISPGRTVLNLALYILFCVPNLGLPFKHTVRTSSLIASPSLSQSNHRISAVARLDKLISMRSNGFISSEYSVFIGASNSATGGQRDQP